MFQSTTVVSAVTICPKRDSTVQLPTLQSRLRIRVRIRTGISYPGVGTLAMVQHQRNRIPTILMRRMACTVSRLQSRMMMVRPVRRQSVCWPVNCRTARLLRILAIHPMGSRPLLRIRVPTRMVMSYSGAGTLVMVLARRNRIRVIPTPKVVFML